MHDLLPHLPQAYKAALFTAGDSLPDLPMLRLNLLGDALQKPEDRNPDHMIEVLNKLNLSKEHFETVLKTWEAGIISGKVSEPLSHWLNTNREADWDNRLQYAQSPSLSAILNIINTYLTKQP